MFYHGKSEETLALIRANWKNILKRANVSMNLVSDLLAQSPGWDEQEMGTSNGNRTHVHTFGNTSAELRALDEEFRNRLQREEAGMAHRDGTPPRRSKSRFLWFTWTSPRRPRTREIDNCGSQIEDILVSEGKDYTWVKDSAWLLAAEKAVARLELERTLTL